MFPIHMPTSFEILPIVRENRSDTFSKDKENAMDTIGLKGIWGLEQLARTGIATWKLGLMLMGGGALLGAILTLVLGDMNSDSILFYPPRIMSTILVLFCFFMGFYLFCALALARSTETDLRLLSRIDDGVGQGMKLLRPTATILLPSILFGLILLQVVPITADVVVRNIPIAERYAALHSSGLVMNVFNYLILPVDGLLGGVLLSILITQSMSLAHVARHLEVDLLQLSRYSAIANPLFRMVVLVLALYSLFPPLILFVDDSTFNAAVAIGALSILLVA